MLIAIIAKILLFLGAALIVGLIVKVVLLTLKAVLSRVKAKLSAKFGTKVFMGAVKKLVHEVTMEAERSGNIHKVDDLLAELGEDGVVMATVNADGTVDDKDIEIISAEKIDDKLGNLLRQNQGEMVLA